MLPRPVLDLLAGAFPGAPIADLAPTSGGRSHHSAALTLGGQRYVVKAAQAAAKRADLRHEARMLALLQGHGLPAPSLRALLEGHGWTVELLPWIAGAPGLELLSGASAQLSQAYGALGGLLAALHRAPLAAPAGDLLLAERASQALRQLPALGLAADLEAALAAALAHPAWQAGPPALLHGDAGLHNILWDAGIAALLDWEWAGWGNPLSDLAWLRWTMRWRNLPAQLWSIVLSGYRVAGPLAGAGDLAALDALALGQIAGVLARVHEDAAAFEEWVRRARWTLAQLSCNF